MTKKKKLLIFRQLSTSKSRWSAASLIRFVAFMMLFRPVFFNSKSFYLKLIFFG